MGRGRLWLAFGAMAFLIPLCVVGTERIQMRSITVSMPMVMAVKHEPCRVARWKRTEEVREMDADQGALTSG